MLDNVSVSVQVEFIEESGRMDSVSVEMERQESNKGCMVLGARQLWVSAGRMTGPV